MKRGIYVADFETSYTDENKSQRHVVLSGMRGVNNDFVNYNYSISSFYQDVKTLMSKDEKVYIYFHNLDYDVSYIEDYFLRHNIQFEETRDANSKTIYALKYENVTLLDSLKLYPASLEKIGETVGIEKLVHTYDYQKIRTNKNDFTDKEIDYFKRDIDVLHTLMVKHFKTHRALKITRAAYAYSDLYRSVRKYHKEDFPKIFDVPMTVEQNNYIRQSYYGGFSYLDQKYAEKNLKNGFTLDVNSLYPYVMESDFPNWEISYETNTIPNKEFYLIDINIKALKLKNKAVPVLPKKMFNGQSAAVKSLEDLADTHAVFTSIDFKHILKNYNIEYDILKITVYPDIIKKPFVEFIAKNNKGKEEAAEKGDSYNKLLFKLSNNSSYGKFAQSTAFENVHPYINEKDTIGFFVDKVETAEKVKNILIATFITAKARNVLFNMIYAINETKGLTFVYSDTDSVHVIESKLNAINDLNVELSKSKLGAWKIESKFTRAKFLRSKVYVEIDDDYVHTFGSDHYQIKAAGITDMGKEKIFDLIEEKGLKAFKFGITLPATQKRHLPGGYDIVDITKTIKRQTAIAKKVNVMGWRFTFKVLYFEYSQEMKNETI